MTSKTSLFNKGIYASTIKRFLWGSIMYFAALFLYNILPFLVSEPYDYRNIKSGWYLFQYSMNTFNVIVSSVVPYVAALLVIRFVHSKKQSIFIHSLPANRSTIFISSALAAMTLMIAPVVANGLILMTMSVFGYSSEISILSVLVWISINILCNFIMFSIASVCCMLTGNSFGAAAIYFIVHLVPLIITTTLSEFLCDFILGFYGGNDITSFIGEINPFTFLMRVSDSINRLIQNDYIYTENWIFKAIPVYLIVSIALIFVSFILYRNRKLENVEDVAGFKCMNPIFKYLLTFTVAITTLAVIANFNHISFVAAIIVFILTTGISYFICEMVLKKTLKVFGSYKGYIGFVCLVGILLLATKITGGFGYEKYVPDINEIKAVSVSSYNGYNGDVKINDADFIKLATEVHKERIEKGITIKNYDSRFTSVNINYEMNNGKISKRRYYITEKEMNDIFDRLYTFDEYVINYDNFFSVNPDEIVEMQLNDDKHSKQFIIDKEQQKDLYEAIEKDILNLSYKEMRCIQNPYSFSVSIKYLAKDNNVDYKYYDYEREYSRVFSEGITPHYKNTIEWLDNMGYLDLISIPHNGKLYIRQGEYSYIDGVELLSDTIVVDNEEEVDEILDFVLKTPTRNTSTDLVYTIYYNPVPDYTSSVRELCEVNLDMMPAVFRQYIKIKLP